MHKIVLIVYTNTILSYKIIPKGYSILWAVAAVISQIKCCCLFVRNNASKMYVINMSLINLYLYVN